MLNHLLPLSSDLCRQIEQQGTLRNYSKGESLYLQGDELDSPFFILSGLVSLWVDSPDHHQYIITTLGPGQMTGDIALINGAARTHSCISLEPCSVLKVDNKFLGNLLRTNLEFSNFINHMLSKKVLLGLNLVYRSKIASKTQALADILLDIIRIGHSNTFSITQAQLAQMAGCSRPKALSILKKLEDQGAIRHRYGKLEILDQELLEKIALPQTWEPATRFPTIK